MVLKFLGELGDEAESKGIYGAAVTCVPFDPIASQGKLDQGFSRAVYSANFLASLKAKAELEILRFPGSFDIATVRSCINLGDFDEAYIARIYGFRDKVDYYRQSGAKWWLSKIRVPVVAINARDDPFIEESSLPTALDVGEVAPVRLIYHDYGGHCGFSTNQRYMGYEASSSSATVVAAGGGVAGTLKAGAADSSAADGGDDVSATTAATTSVAVATVDVQLVPPHGWLAEELSRFLSHVKENM